MYKIHHHYCKNHIKEHTYPFLKNYSTFKKKNHYKSDLTKHSSNIKAAICYNSISNIQNYLYDISSSNVSIQVIIFNISTLHLILFLGYYSRYFPKSIFIRYFIFHRTICEWPCYTTTIWYFLYFQNYI